ncbi:cytidylate kinase [Candidatus Woesearchaeota archaeon]|nr:cytidylate kinase [Candidatus Woesearchaeota archaeon]|tara:strand:- start:527 stop:1063 length:537 start_codon:yes stop_codon:yes gene_type:complete
MIISISGKAGSGKSTVAKQLAKQLNLKHYSIGDLMRQIAKEKHISLFELGKLAERDKTIDTELDRKQMALREEDEFVIDGRLSAYFIPNSDLKVFLDCDDKVRAERIKKEGRKDEFSTDINETVKQIKERELSERKRYKKYYNVDYSDKELYGLIIDTTNLSVKQVVDGIMKAVAEGK